MSTKVVSEKWTTVRLGWLFQPISDRGHEDATVLSVYRDHGVIPKGSRTDNFNRTPENLSNYQLVRPGHLVVNRMKAWQGSLGISEYEGIVSPDYEVLRPIASGYDRRFVHSLLRSRGLIDQYALRSTGIRPSQWRLYWDRMKTIEVSLPSVGEQRAIADYLDRETARIDTLIEEQQRLIELQRERRAAMVDATLAPLSSWTRTALKHVLDGIDQGVSPQAETGLADGPGMWGVLKTGCVNRGVFRSEEHKRLPGDFPFDPAITVEVGDVIVSRANGSPDLVGSAAIVEHLDYRLILSDKLFRLRPRRSTDARFLVWSLNSGRYRTQVHRAISGADGLANNLPLSSLRSFEMHFPSLEEQRRIAAYLDDQTASIDMLIVETERFIELARERRSALITAAVMGQIDVRQGA
ncbi:restriction endonuclease subunit S [Streptomyces sp. NRRL F-5053]|uniref:restriction endonuclease subunit S n=1 Tax=Streptomyces sp. NRRL F-5053 TaxID=1463854 RepID=UPI000691E89E|nr:restriction endonuclease subunit S [Streptomyces sp. NRRL F-5053]